MSKNIQSISGRVESANIYQIINEENGEMTFEIPAVMRGTGEEDNLDEVCGYRTVVQGSGVQEMWVPCDNRDEKGNHPKSCEVCEDRKGWFDDPSNIHAHFTTTGDNPVTLSAVEKMSFETPRNFWEESPLKRFYSAAKEVSGEVPHTCTICKGKRVVGTTFKKLCVKCKGRGFTTTRVEAYPKAESNDEGKVVSAILRADHLQGEAKRARLEALWKRFWEKHFAYAECGSHWLTPRAVKRITKMFNDRNIMSKNQKAKMLGNPAKAFNNL